jgi:GH15 family glucan-1,4-alpha-glucosidase
LSLRNGDKQVYYLEINAMWYNALMFYAELCCSARFLDDAGKASRLAHIVRQSLIRKFYDEKAGYFANSLDSDGNKDTTFCVGQLLAFALPYAIADSDKIAIVLPLIEQKLLTPVGLRNIDADSPKYATEGFITPFYLGFLAEIYIKLRGADGCQKAKELYLYFDNELNITIPPNFYEKYTPLPPYEGIGAPMSAVTIATINRIRLLLAQF